VSTTKIVLAAVFGVGAVGLAAYLLWPRRPKANVAGGDVTDMRYSGNWNDLNPEYKLPLGAEGAAAAMGEGVYEGPDINRATGEQLPPSSGELADWTAPGADATA